jgi:TP901 family phage tail tape measure protein
MAGRFSVEAVFKAVDKVTAPVTRMQNRVGKMTRSMERSFNRLNLGVKNFTDNVKKGAIAVTAALALSTGAMANVISTGAEFEQTLVAAAAKYPGEIRKGTEAFKQLEDAARKTGATTEFTASQSAQALNFLAMAGFNAENSISALPAVVDLATAAQVDLATATDIATDALGAFGLSTKDPAKLTKNLARVNDVLAKTATTANTTIEQLFESMKKAGPVATTAGASIETVAALMGTMANSGIKAEKAGTAVANMFLNLTTPSSKAAKVMRKLRVNVLDANNQMRDVPDILGDLNKAIAPLTKAQRLSVLESIFGREGLAGVATVVEGGADAFKAYRKQLEGATGASGTMASVMRDTLQGRLNSLKSAVEGVKISIFSMTEGPLSDVIVRMTDWVRANEDLIASKIGGFLALVLNNLDAIGSALLAIGKGVAAVIALGIALKTVSAVLGIINLIMMANPIVLGIMAAVAAVALLSGKLDPVLEIIKSIGSGISDAFSAVGSLGAIFGMGDDEDKKAQAAVPQMVSPQDRVARSVQESRTTSTAEVTIRDETGRAEVTGGKLGGGLALEKTGAL